MTDERALAIAKSWLVEMESCVRAQDYERARAIFAEDAVGFGTRAAMVVGREALEREQWRQIWGTIRDFTFLTDRLHCRLMGDDDLWLAGPWTSEGRAASGEWNDRPGRMTVILCRQGERWVAVHTHFSLVPVRR